jgi:glycosyltransferase involved in cell wall biosynthesis
MIEYARAVLPDPARWGGPLPNARVHGLSVVLPAYNEEANIGPMIEAALDVLPGLAEQYEIVVVDDGSRDATAKVAEDWVERHHPAVRLLRHPRNLGYGAAIRTVFQHARGDLVFYTDADRQFDLAELGYFLPLVADHDLVIGFRVYRYDSVLRSIISWFYNRLVEVLFRVRVRDVDCAFKLIRREVLDRITLQSDDFFIDTEIIACARKWDFRIAQKGVRHYPRVAGETTVQYSDIPRTVRTVLHMWRRIYRPSATQRSEAEAIAGRVNAVEHLPEAAER